jgi:CHAT domain-containing protein
VVIISVISFFILKISIKKHIIPEPSGSFESSEQPPHVSSIPAVTARDLTTLSIEKRTSTEYNISLESRTTVMSPVITTRSVYLSQKVRSEIIDRIDYTSKAIMQHLCEKKRKKTNTTEKLKEMGTVLYKNFIPRDFSHKLSHFLVLEVEDTQLPWELMYHGQFFALKYALSRRIKSETLLDVQPKKGNKTALLIADPTETLPEALAECEYLFKALKNDFTVTYLRPHQASKVDVMYHLSQEYDIIHYAGELSSTKYLPVYKDVLTCEEIEKNMEGSPIVFINGCKSAKVLSAHIHGLAEVFLNRGALSFIGSMWSVHNEKTADIALSFYKKCLLYPVGEALRLSRIEHYTPHDITWAAFVMYGDPTLPILR